MLKKTTQEPLDQFQPHLVENMLGDSDLFYYMGWPLWGSLRGKIRKL